MYMWIVQAAELDAQNAKAGTDFPAGAARLEILEGAS